MSFDGIRASPDVFTVAAPEAAKMGIAIASIVPAMANPMQ
jgi:hypothetical protein